MPFPLGGKLSGETCMNPSPWSAFARVVRRAGAGAGGPRVSRQLVGGLEKWRKMGGRQQLGVRGTSSESKRRRHSNTQPAALCTFAYCLSGAPLLKANSSATPCLVRLSQNIDASDEGLRAEKTQLRRARRPRFARSVGKVVPVIWSLGASRALTPERRSSSSRECTSRMSSGTRGSGSAPGQHRCWDNEV